MTPDRPALGPIELAGRFVRLEPLREAHVPGLIEAAADDRIWVWLPRNLKSPDAMAEFVAISIERERAGLEFPFTVIATDTERVLGSTRYMDIHEKDRGVEVGWTWYAADVWQTAVNPEAKLLLLSHAFEAWNAIRVCLKTDERNAQSRAAIAKLGARFEGLLRNQRIRPDGSYRATAMYSIIDGEWPTVKAGLQARVASFG